MKSLLRSRLLWAALALVILAANVFLRWPHRSGPTPPRPGGAPPAPSAEDRARFESALQQLPAEQRAAVQTRLAEDRAFFESVQSLPEKERQEKVRQHLAQATPIPGLPFPPPLGGGSPGGPGAAGGPGGPGGGPASGRLPDPAMRKSMDQHIVDTQRQAGAGGGGNP